MEKIVQENTGMSFTPRESECITQALQNKSLSQIAENLEISPQSVCFYLRNGIQKLSLLLQEEMKETS
jgi:DNA-binding CsgD family transcriptional regulator